MTFDGFTTMTVDELVSTLQDGLASGEFTAGQPVVLASDYGDRRHTMQALPVRLVRAYPLAETGYSQSGYRVCSPFDHRDQRFEDDPEADEAPPRDQEVVVLHSSLLS